MKNFSQRILVYAQHLSGVGHYVRTFEIARTLAPHHEVYWVEGGRPVPHTPCPQLNIVELPRIRRAPDGRLQGLDPGQDIDALMRARAERLLGAVARIRPQVFLVEYFPFSKWELADELLPAIDAVHRDGGRVLCSLRDVVRKTRFETLPDASYTAQVTDLLNRRFDGLLVHADPAITRLEEHFAAVSDIQIPINYTGIVSAKPVPSSQSNAEIARVTRGRPFVLASAGGGAGGRQLIECVARTWQDPRVAGGRPLAICAGLGWPEDELRDLTQGAAQARILIMPFRDDFLHWLAAADLSISQCGYNTAANLLETCTPAIVCPNPEMSDQPIRARRLDGLGLVELFDLQWDCTAGLSRAVDRNLGRSRCAHKVDLRGADNTRALIEASPVQPF